MAEGEILKTISLRVLYTSFKIRNLFRADRDDDSVARDARSPTRSPSIFDIVYEIGEGLPTSPSSCYAGSARVHAVLRDERSATSELAKPHERDGGEYQNSETAGEADADV
jgi:hypothetical protein